MPQDFGGSPSAPHGTDKPAHPAQARRLSPTPRWTWPAATGDNRVNGIHDPRERP